MSWQPDEFEPWAIEPYEKGIIAFSRTRDRRRTATIFCRADHVPRLLLTLDALDDPSNLLGIWSTVHGASVFGQTIPRAEMALKVKNGKALWELAMRNFDPNVILTNGSYMVSPDAPHSAYGYFWRTLAPEAFQPMVKAALRNCL